MERESHILTAGAQDRLSNIQKEWNRELCSESRASRQFAQPVNKLSKQKKEYLKSGQVRFLADPENERQSQSMPVSVSFL